MSTRTRAVVAVLTLAAAGAGLWWVRQRNETPGRVGRGDGVTAVGLGGADGAPQPPVPLPDERPGSPDERGTGAAVQLDLARAQQEGVQPIVEFLTYLQAKRGDEGHLLFVRFADLDAIAAREGSDVEEFLDRLDQLGVVVSQN